MCPFYTAAVVVLVSGRGGGVYQQEVVVVQPHGVGDGAQRRQRGGHDREAGLRPALLAVQQHRHREDDEAEARGDVGGEHDAGEEAEDGLEEVGPALRHERPGVCGGWWGGGGGGGGGQSRASFERGGGRGEGGVGPKSLCTKNGPIRFSQRYISFFGTMVTWVGGVEGVWGEGSPPHPLVPPWGRGRR